MDDYRLYKAGITENGITAARARELYEDARSRPDSDLDGDLATGFHYYATASEGLRLVRCHVLPAGTPWPSG